MDGGLDDRTLRRIIALLVSFALLAERSAARSLPVRWLVLAILRRAEAVALNHVAETTALDLACFADDPRGGHEPIDAAILAWRLRALAGLLGALLGPASRSEGRGIGRDAGPRGGASFAHPVFIVRFGSPLGLYDTS